MLFVLFGIIEGSSLCSAWFQVCRSKSIRRRLWSLLHNCFPVWTKNSLKTITCHFDIILHWNLLSFYLGDCRSLLLFFRSLWMDCRISFVNYGEYSVNIQQSLFNMLVAICFIVFMLWSRLLFFSDLFCIAKSAFLIFYELLACGCEWWL